MGPGKADLLEAIGAEGSLASAARGLGMSYMRAWRLAQEMNAAFREPLVELRRGARGGARLTAEGQAVLALYREIDRAARRAAEPGWRKMRRRLRLPG
jgi:molybdate transport system regulatory protein